MSLFLETILIRDGKARYLPYHTARFNATRRDLFSLPPSDLALAVAPPPGSWRCRLLYDTHIRSVEYLPLVRRTWRRLDLVRADGLTYPYKDADRASLDLLRASRPDADDVIIVRDGLISDTTIANIALYDGSRWLTPKTPLLPGTTRARLIDEGAVILADIPAASLGRYENIALMNALIGFCPLPFTPAQILPLSPDGV